VNKVRTLVALKGPTLEYGPALAALKGPTVNSRRFQPTEPNQHGKQPRRGWPVFFWLL